MRVVKFDSLYLGVIFSYPPFIVHSIQPTIAIWVYRSPKGTVVKTIGYENSMVVEPGFLHEVGTNFEIGKPLVGLSYCGIGEEGRGSFCRMSGLYAWSINIFGLGFSWFFPLYCNVH